MIAMRSVAAALLALTVGASYALQGIPVAHRPSANAAARAAPPEAFDLYPAPNSPPVPGASGFFKDFGKQKMDPEMLKAAGIVDKKPRKRPAKSKTSNKEAAEAPGSLGVALGGFAVVAAIVLATQAGS